MFKIQIVIFAALATVTFQNLIKANRLTLDRMDRHSEAVNKPRLDFVPIDSTVVTVRLGNIIKDTASTNEIIANRGLRIILKGYPSGFKAAVLGFDITTVNQNRDTIAVNVSTSGNLLSKDQIHELKKLNGYGKVIFHRIRAVGGSGSVRELPPFSLTVRG
jgi:hypothetical protein